VFAGTTNTRDYLRDETGNRRFWPVSCGRIDCDALARDREQLWAEAVALFDDGATWWPERADLIEALTKEQEARVSVDPWLERISRFIEALDDVKAERIMSECLELEVSRQGQAERNRVGRCLRLLNWEPSQWREGEVRVRGFRRIK
jgi:predicted P-loop ATPase